MVILGMIILGVVILGVVVKGVGVLEPLNKICTKSGSFRFFFFFFFFFFGGEVKFVFIFIFRLPYVRRSLLWRKRKHIHQQQNDSQSIIWGALSTGVAHIYRAIAYASLNPWTPPYSCYLVYVSSLSLSFYLSLSLSLSLPAPTYSVVLRLMDANICTKHHTLFKTILSLTAWLLMSHNIFEKILFGWFNVSAHYVECIFIYTIHHDVNESTCTHQMIHKFDVIVVSFAVNRWYPIDFSTTCKQIFL